MNILAVESCTGVASAAIVKDNVLVCEKYCDVGLTHSQTLMPMIENILNDAMMKLDEIDYFAVDVGPGSYTGIRIGVASVNAMAFALDKKIVQVNSLFALKENAIYNKNICSIIDARQNRIYAKYFAGSLQCDDDLFAGTIESFLKKVDNSKQTIFIGDGATAQKQIIIEHMKDNAIFAPYHLNKLRASSIAYYSGKKIESGEVVCQAEPLYLNMPKG